MSNTRIRTPPYFGTFVGRPSRVGESHAAAERRIKDAALQMAKVRRACEKRATKTVVSARDVSVNVTVTAPSSTKANTPCGRPSSLSGQKSLERALSTWEWEDSTEWRTAPRMHATHDCGFPVLTVIAADRKESSRQHPMNTGCDNTDEAQDAEKGQEPHLSDGTVEADTGKLRDEDLLSKVRNEIIQAVKKAKGTSQLVENLQLDAGGVDYDAADASQAESCREFISAVDDSLRDADDSFYLWRIRQEILGFVQTSAEDSQLCEIRHTMADCVQKAATTALDVSAEDLKELRSVPRRSKEIDNLKRKLKTEKENLDRDTCKLKVASESSSSTDALPAVDHVDAYRLITLRRDIAETVKMAAFISEIETESNGEAVELNATKDNYDANTKVPHCLGNDVAEAIGIYGESKMTSEQNQVHPAEDVIKHVSLQTVHETTVQHSTPENVLLTLLSDEYIAQKQDQIDHLRAALEAAEAAATEAEALQEIEEQDAEALGKFRHDIAQIVQNTARNISKTTEVSPATPCVASQSATHTLTYTSPRFTKQDGSVALAIAAAKLPRSPRHARPDGELAVIATATLNETTLGPPEMSPCVERRGEGSDPDVYPNGDQADVVHVDPVRGAAPGNRDSDTESRIGCLEEELLVAYARIEELVEADPKSVTPNPQIAQNVI